MEPTGVRTNSSCPDCRGSDWKAARLAYREGLSVTSSRTEGNVLGIGRVGIRNGKTAIGGGVYRGRTSGVQQTMLSKLAAPPQKRKGFIVFLAILFVILGLAAVANLTSGQYFGLGLYQGSIKLGILIVVLSWLSTKDSEEYTMPQ